MVKALQNKECRVHNGDNSVVQGNSMYAPGIEENKVKASPSQGKERRRQGPRTVGTQASDLHPPLEKD